MNDRITELEMLLMHVQKTLQDLDDVARLQNARLDSLERDLQRLNLEMGLLRESAIDERNPEEERPPHY